MSTEGVHSRDMGRGNSRDMGRGNSREGGGEPLEGVLQARDCPREAREPEWAGCDSPERAMAESGAVAAARESGPLPKS